MIKVRYKAVANLGKIKMKNINSLIRNDICKNREPEKNNTKKMENHPELEHENRVFVYATQDDKVVLKMLKDWKNYKHVQRRVRERMKQRLVNCKDVMNRNDIIGMSSLIVQIPKDIRVGDERKFFEGVRDFCESTFGLDKMLIVAEHCHEHRRHVQIYWMPIVFDKKNNQEKLCAKEFHRYSLYKNLHPNLQKYMDEKMGYHVSVRIGDDKENTKNANALKVKTLKAQVRELQKKIKDLSKKSNWFSKELAEAEATLEDIKKAYPQEYAQLTARRKRGQGTKVKSQAMMEYRYKSINNIADDTDKAKERQERTRNM